MAAKHKKSHEGEDSGKRARTSKAQAGVVRAQQGGERTTETVPHLICLLDAEGRIARMNSAVESWGLDSIVSVLGRDLHAMLHPQCAMIPCQMATEVATCCRHRQREDPYEVDLHTHVLQRFVHLSAWHLPSHGSADAASDQALTVVVVADVTAMSSAREALRTLDQELEACLQLHTGPLGQANQALQNDLVRQARAEEVLRRSRSELTVLSRALIEAQERERQAIARELYGSIGQSLSAMKYSFEHSEELTRRSRAHDSQLLLQRAIVALQDAMDDVRSMAMRMRPCTLDDFGAVSAVREFCREFAVGYPGISVHEEISMLDSGIPQRLAPVVFRSVQELLINAAERIHAQSIIVSLSHASGKLVLEVREDGVAVGTTADAERWRGDADILCVRERVEMNGGEFNVLTSQDRSGTRVRAQWPLSPEERTGCEAH